MSTLTTAGITFGDATSQTTAATAAGLVTTTNVLNATAGASLGAVGTYAAAVYTAGTNIAAGATTAGSNLRYDPISGAGIAAASQTTGVYSGGGTAFSGTWRRMGGGKVYSALCCSVNLYSSGLFLRIS